MGGSRWLMTWHRATPFGAPLIPMEWFNGTFLLSKQSVAQVYYTLSITPIEVSTNGQMGVPHSKLTFDYKSISVRLLINIANDTELKWNLFINILIRLRQRQLLIKIIHSYMYIQ